MFALLEGGLTILTLVAGYFLLRHLVKGIYNLDRRIAERQRAEAAARRATEASAAPAPAAPDGNSGSPGAAQRAGRPAG